MKKEEDITIEEAKKLLEEKGIPTGSWKNTEPKGDAKAFTLPSFQAQAKGLEKLAELIKNQVDRDQEKVAELSMKLNRLRYGGGR